MNNINYQNYLDYIQCPKKSTCQLQSFLQHKGFLEVLDISHVPDGSLTCFLLNAINKNGSLCKKDKSGELVNFEKCLSNIRNNRKETLKDLKLSIKAYKFTKNRKNNNFYRNYSSDTGERFVYVLLDEKHNVIYSNCSKLFLEMIIYLGVNQCDIDIKSKEYQLYVSAIHSYIELCESEKVAKRMVKVRIEEQDLPGTKTDDGSAS